jgi:magnesium transporter
MMVVLAVLAMLTNLIAGALGGLSIPQLLNRFRINPAVSPSAFVTTVTGVVGYGPFTGIATVRFELG